MGASCHVAAVYVPQSLSGTRLEDFERRDSEQKTKWGMRFGMDISFRRCGNFKPLKKIARTGQRRGDRRRGERRQEVITSVREMS